ncbi:MAG: hypothetical protein J7K23_00895 [Thermoproteales archaeon]|nr:hypothetical protein [Thermoproteales archaeon]
MVKEDVLRKILERHNMNLKVIQFKKVDHLVVKYRDKGLTVRLFLKTKLENVPLKVILFWLGIKDDDGEK